MFPVELLVLLRPESVVPVPLLLVPVLLPLGLNALPVAPLMPASPKYEKTLWRQLGWFRSVLASKLGADSSLLESPAKVKLGCCELVVAVLLLRLEELLAPAADERKSIQGTATCLPVAEALDEEAEELMPVLLELAPGLVLVLELLPLREMTANSNRPEFGLTIASLMVPMAEPDKPLTWAPVSWLTRNASWPMRPVGLMWCPRKPDGLLDELSDPNELGLVVLELG